MIRVGVVDDQAMIRGAFSTLLSLEDDMTVVGEAANGTEALALVADADAANTPIDVLLTDIEMPLMDGITACEAVRARFPHTRILMLTTFGRPGYVQRAVDAGAAGFIVKDSPSEQLASAVRTVAAGGKLIDPSLAVEALTRGPSPLTDREVEILREVAGGGTIADIATSVDLSQGTVRNHISAVMMKTGGRTRAEAVRIATEAGWL
ncbi:MAG: DNA-binding response regulator [Actinobacteria bacterium]|nr:MAG: DNA-binding response regulator [Actinomycetota bacterium]